MARKETKVDTAAEGTTAVRVLVRTPIDGEWVEANAVLDLTADQLQAYAGAVDADPDAVAYAKSLLSE